MNEPTARPRNHYPTNTLEVALANKFIDAFKAYKLNPMEAVATIEPVYTLDPGHQFPIDAEYTDGLKLHISSRVIIDKKRQEQVNQVMNEFITDFIRAAGVDVKAEGVRESVRRYGENGWTRATFECDNFEECKTRPGQHRSANDVYYALDKMIASKSLGISL